jgi:branched-chain amino acid transport system permease protein
MDLVLITLVNSLGYGLLLFLLSAGLTLVYGLMGVLNFAHASFYMLGAYFAYSFSGIFGFFPALLLVPLLVGALGALFEMGVLRPAYRHGAGAQLLVTFGFSYLMVELVQLVWGRGPVDYSIPSALNGVFAQFGRFQVSQYRVFSMAAALVVMGAMWLVLVNTRWGLVIQAAVTHGPTLQTLGHNVPRVYTLVFAGGAALAGLAGVLGGNAYVTEPAMALQMGAMAFVVVVVGGLGSVTGAFWAAMGLGILQTIAVGWAPSTAYAPLLPFVLLAAVLVWRPEGLLGKWVHE